MNNDDTQPESEIPEVPECIRARMKDIDSILQAPSPVDMHQFRILTVHNGSRIFYKEELRREQVSYISNIGLSKKKPSKPIKPKEFIVDKFLLEYSVKGPSPDFVIKALRDTGKYL